MTIPDPVCPLAEQGPLTDADLLALLPTMGKSQFYKRKAKGDFRFLEMSPQLPDSHTLYSRRLVTRWFEGVDLEAGAPRRHFGKASGAKAHAPRFARPCAIRNVNDVAVKGVD